MINPPRVRSSTVDKAIKRAFAVLARKHFERAIASIGLLEKEYGAEADRRMVFVEEYLEKAGAEAARNHF